MKQMRNQKAIINTQIGPMLPSSPKINQDISDFQESSRTNSTIAKDFVIKEKCARIKDLNKKITSIPDYVSTSEYWNKLKNSTKTTSKIIQNATKDGLKESKGPVNKFKKFVTGIFIREKYPGERDLELLTKLAELKQKKIITQKEFNLKKKKILAKI
ncbi:hypothetical protein [Nitrosopumilus sp. b2]|uniref:hypothetical protein n=1 Tax=Nitrosopumilus sp. b2 TaxID=2109908 RepID=UPI0015F5AAD0|nr:hypothetical protein [Nitrosopumilus sp. b2]